MINLDYIANRVLAYIICGLVGFIFWKWRRRK